MIKIYKYELKLDLSVQTGGGYALATVELPANARILHYHAQDYSACLWAEVDVTADFTETHRYAVAPTGVEPPDPSEGWVYVGTIHIHGGTFVWHLYHNDDCLNTEMD